MSSGSQERRRVVYSGRVQGVGFRMTTARIAKSYPVLGFVRNQPDGTVELVAVGESIALNGFLQDVSTHFQRNIRAAADEPYDGREEFSAFEVRR